MGNAVRHFSGSHYLQPNQGEGKSVEREWNKAAELGSKALLLALEAQIAEVAKAHGLSFEWAKTYCANSRVPS